MNLYYEIPANINAVAIIEALSEHFEVNQTTKHYTLKTFYDSFDWRLWRHDLICEFSRSNTHSVLNLIARKKNEPIASSVVFDLPSFASQFNPGKVRNKLEPALQMRALLPIGTIECDISQFEVYDKTSALLMRIVLEEYESINACLYVIPEKSQEKTVKTLFVNLSQEFSLAAKNKPVLLDVLKLQGRYPKDYSANLKLPLGPENSALNAYKAVFKQLLHIIQVNEQGVIGDTDSEFLHDFRVAVRKTRVCLNQAKSILPDKVIAEQRAFFSWLGQITGETRDLDVYLLNFDDYRKQLPKVIKQSINPLQHFLLTKKQKTHKVLVQKLRSAKYKTGIKRWSDYLSSSPAISDEDHSTTPNIKTIADLKIKKLYKQALKQGEAIDKNSPPEAFHTLRKTCKKLRYMLEFFQSLYPENKIDRLLKRLKQLQKVLGDYQDFAVQQEKLEQFSDEMQKTNIPSRTYLAMGVLIQNLEERKAKANSRFSSRFDKFNKADTHADFKDLIR